MKIEDNENKEFLSEDEDLLYDELDENSYDHSSNEIESDIESGDENYSEEIKLVEDDDDCVYAKKGYFVDTDYDILNHY